MKVSFEREKIKFTCYCMKLESTDQLSQVALFQQLFSEQMLGNRFSK